MQRGSKCEKVDMLLVPSKANIELILLSSAKVPFKLKGKIKEYHYHIISYE